jgi:opacity protein-like surface antigen
MSRALVTFRGQRPRPLSSVCLVVVLISAALAPRVASADDNGDADFGRSGAYVGVGGSRVFDFIEDSLDGLPVLTDIKVDDIWGVNGRAGYRLTSWLALEGEYEWLDDIHAHLGSLTIAHIGTQIATANVRLIWPLGRFQPYLLGGAGAMFLNTRGIAGLDVDRTAFTGRVGLGIDVYLTKSVLVEVGADALLTDARISLDTPFGSVTENAPAFVTLQFGLGYRF